MKARWPSCCSLNPAVSTAPGPSDSHCLGDLPRHFPGIFPHFKFRSRQTPPHYSGVVWRHQLRVYSVFPHRASLPFCSALFFFTALTLIVYCTFIVYLFSSCPQDTQTVSCKRARNILILFYLSTLLPRTTLCKSVPNKCHICWMNQLNVWLSVTLFNSIWLKWNFSWKWLSKQKV